MILPFFEVPGLEHVTDKPEKPLVMYLPRQDREQDSMINVVKAAGNIALDEPHGPGPGAFRTCRSAVWQPLFSRYACDLSENCGS